MTTINRKLSFVLATFLALSATSFPAVAEQGRGGFRRQCRLGEF